MRWDCSGFSECSFAVDVQAVSNIDHFPAFLGFSSWAAGDLDADYDETHSLQLAQQVRLDGSNEPAVMPVHQSSLFDRVGKVHEVSWLLIF
jgi:hypothetical protein